MKGAVGMREEQYTQVHDSSHSGKSMTLCKPPIPPEPLKGLPCPPKPPTFTDLSSGLLDE